VDFTLTEEQVALRDRVAAFSRSEVRPLWDRFETDRGLVIGLAGKAGDLGLLEAAKIENGGLLDLTSAAILIEELAWGEGSLALAVADGYLRRAALALLSNASAQPSIVQSLKSAPARHAIVLWPGPAETEGPAMATVAEGRLRVAYNGRITNRQAPAFIGGALLADGAASGRHALYFVNAEDAVVEFETRDCLGLNASSMGDLRLEKQIGENDCFVEFENDELYFGFWQALCAQRTVLYGAALVGISRAAFEYALDYSKERTTFGKPIVQHQAVGLKLADMAIGIEAARLMTWRAAEPRDGCLDPELVEAAWLYAKEVSIDVAIDAVQTLGGHGYLKLHPVEKWMRDVQTLRLFF
jgi:alkylation response protein AidB-like acyl-CoA dehydrogenase